MLDFLLIHPPAVKPAEPPLGPAVLLAHLRACGLRGEVLDANLAAYLHLLRPERLAAAAGAAAPTALRRAVRHAEESLAFLRSPAAAASFPRYVTAVGHLNRALTVWGDGGERLSLGDYRHGGLSEFAPADLERLAAGDGKTLFSEYFREILLPQVAELRPRLVGISVNYRHQILPAFELAGLLGRRFPELPVVGGGGVFSSWRAALRRRDLRFSPFSRLIFGPGEGPLAALAAGSAPADYFLEEPAPVAFRPDFSFARLADYLSPLPVLPVSASRGCYWQKCLFCPEAAAPIHSYACLPPAEFPALLRRLAVENGVGHFHFTDDAVPAAVLRQLAGAGAEMAGITWHGFVRFERPLLEPALPAALAAAGCRLLQLGLESGSQAVLDRLRKGTRLDEAATILANLRTAGIAAFVYVLLGTPGESAAEAGQTLAFLEEHAEAIDFLNLAIMNLPRGVAPDELAAEEPLGFYRESPASPGWERGDVRRFLQGRLLGSPAIRTIVNRTPPVFTSNHAFLFR